MKISIETGVHYFGETEEFGGSPSRWQTLKIDGIGSLHACECNENNEDGYLGKDIPDLNDVVSLMRRAYKAGKEGVIMTFENII